MKRKILSLLIALCFVMCIPVAVHATFQDVQYVVDQADILTDQDNITLDGTAEALSQTYGMDILIATVHSLNGQSAQDFADGLTENHWWDTDNAIVFLIAMEEREWYISTSGEAITAFTDYSLAKLGDLILPYLSDGYYYEGFEAYLNVLPEYLDAYEAGVPVDGYYYNSSTQEYRPNEPKTIWSVLPVSLLIGIAAAAVVILVMRSSMNTRRKQSGAADYLMQNSYHLRTQQDMFLYSNVTKTRKQQSSGSRGGSSVHRSSGGRSHGGRGGRF